MILDIILGLGIVATTISGIYWGNRIREAKEAEIAAKDAHIAMLENLVSPDLLEFFKKANDMLLAKNLASSEEINTLKQKRDELEIKVNTLLQELKELKDKGEPQHLIDSKRHDLVASMTAFAREDQKIIIATGLINTIGKEPGIRIENIEGSKKPQDSKES